MSLCSVYFQRFILFNRQIVVQMQSAIYERLISTRPADNRQSKKKQYQYIRYVSRIKCFLFFFKLMKSSNNLFYYLFMYYIFVIYSGFGILCFCIVPLYMGFLLYFMAMFDLMWIQAGIQCVKTPLISYLYRIFVLKKEIIISILHLLCLFNS